MDMETSFINQMPMLLGLTTFTNMVWEVLLPLTDPLLHTNQLLVAMVAMAATERMLAMVATERMLAMVAMAAMAATKATVAMEAMPVTVA